MRGRQALQGHGMRGVPALKGWMLRNNSTAQACGSPYCFIALGWGPCHYFTESSDFLEVGSWEVAKLAFKPGVKNGETGSIHGPCLPAHAPVSLVENYR